MAILKQTYVSGNLYVTESNSYVSASEFRGMLVGTASYANEALTASHALNVAPNADLFVNSLHVSGGAQVDGDLKVLGDLTYVGVQDLRVKDHTIEVNADESGSAVGSANGAGVVIKNTDAAGDIELIYSSSDDKLHVNKTIAGTIDSASEAAHAVSASRADSAESADKVAFKLSFGTGISASVSPKEYDGSQAVVIDVNPGTIADTVVSRSVSASVAATAEKVQEKLTYAFTGSDGTAAAAVEYDGHEAKTITVDLSGLETKEHASASVADLQEQIDSMTGGAGSIAEQINAATASLNGDASAEASGTAVSGGVFVLSGVAINEAGGKLTSGSATSVEVEKAGEAAKAKAELLGAASDATGSMTLHGIKNYVDAKTGDGVQALSQSVATNIANVMASQSAASQSISQSIATVASNALNQVESSSYIAVSEKAENKQTISAKTHTVADADATTGDGLAVASDVKAYVDSQVTGKNVSAEGDEWVAASAANNKVTVETNIKAVASATAADDGLAKASDIKSYVDTAVNTLSGSVAATDAAQDTKIANLEASASAAETAISNLETSASAAADAIEALQEASATYATTASLITFASSANSRLNALETASATHVTSASLATIVENQAKVDATQSARLDTLESASAVLDDKYVKKAGDAMTGALTASADGIVFGDMKIVWNAQAGAIEFVANE